MPFFIGVPGVLSALFWMLAWLNPDHSHPWITFMNEASMMLALMFAALARLALPWPSGQPPNPLMTRVVLTFAALWALLQWRLGTASTQVVVIYAGTCLAAALAYTLGGSLAAQTPARRDEGERLALTVLAVTALLSAGMVWIQTLDLSDYYFGLVAEIGDNRPFGNLGQPNNEATFLAMGVVAVDILATRRWVHRTRACRRGRHSARGGGRNRCRSCCASPRIAGRAGVRR